MGFLSIFRKSKNVSVIPLNGVIAANMGRRKGLNLNELDKNIEQAFAVKKLIFLSPDKPPFRTTINFFIIFPQLF